MAFASGVGRCNLDILYTGMKRLPREGEEIYSKGLQVEMGGGTPATMLNLHRLGIPVKLGTFLGEDFFSDFIKKNLDGENLEYVNFQKEKGNPVIITTAMVTPADRTFISYEDQRSKVNERELYELLTGARTAIIYAGYKDVYQQLKKEGTKLFFDSGWEDELSFAKYHDELTLADYFTPSRAEAFKISGTKSLKEAAAAIGEYVEHTLIKLDKDGALIVENGVMELILPAPDIKAVDSTGAGDAFLAGFIYGIYHRYSFPESVVFGNITGGACVQQVGCMAGYVTEEQLLAQAAKIERVPEEKFPVEILDIL